MRRGTAALGAIALLCTALSGCVGSARAGSPSCGWVASHRAAGGDAPAADAVVLVDRSSSFRRQGPASTALRDAVIEAATAAFARPGVRLISIGAFDGASTSVDWQIRSAALPVSVGTDRSQRRDLKAVHKCLDDPVSTLLDSTPARPASDVLGALDAGRRQFATPAARQRTLTVFTDGLANTGCGDLRGRQNLSDLVAECAGEHAMPDLHGILLSLEAVGAPTSAGGTLSSEQLNVLIRLWVGLCAATGAQSPTGGSCLGNRLSGGAGDAPVSDGRPDPAVTLLLPKVVRNPKGIMLSIPGDSLFPTDSYTLSPQALATLQTLIRPYAGPSSSALVVGHTDSRGADAYNRALSLRRAQTVAEQLRATGYGVVNFDGVGETQPLCQEFSGNNADAACMARDRRVDIQITTKVLP